MKSSYCSIGQILLADDDVDDCDLFAAAIQEVNPDLSVNIVRNGVELMEHLNTSLPDLLFLDLNMPLKEGLECLKEIRTTERLNKFPIIIYSSSGRPSDIDFSYTYGANIYLRKTYTYQEMKSSLKSILEMDWSKPDAVTHKYLIDNKFFPFENEL